MKINSIQIVNGVQMAVNDVRDYISKMGDPAKAKRFGRTLKLRSDWDDVRLKVMEYGLREKFLKNDDLKELLLQTGNEELVEGNWWGDVFFGVCKGVGENHLGKLLMKIRDEIKQSQTKIPLKF
jgi:ribA/ribD-fused uncharacterized protein